MTDYETRTVTAEVELRGDDDAPTIVGHAATFNQPYQVGYFSEQIHPSAFDRTLRRDDSGRITSDVRLLVDHEGQPLARTKSGTLKLGTDDHGLTVEASLDRSNPKVQEITSALKRGDIDQMSFGFRVPVGGDMWDHNSNPPMRTIREANLSGGDVSIVTYPANENTAVHLRNEDVREAHYTLLIAMVNEARNGGGFDMQRCGQLVAELRGVSPEPISVTGNLPLQFNGTWPMTTTTTFAATSNGVLTYDEATLRAAMATASINDLPDDDFAFIESGGEKDSDGKTTPRSLRHFPIHDAAHVRNALARASQSEFGKQAMPKILAAAKKFGIDVGEQKSSTMPLGTAMRLAQAAALRRNN